MEQGDKLDKYLPEGVAPLVLTWLKGFPVHLRIVRSRKSRLGTYKAPSSEIHTITINHDLNKYSFALTLCHEIAHMHAMHKYGRRIQAHGAEWKMIFGLLLSELAGVGSLPGDVKSAFIRHSKRPKASSASDMQLMKVLSSYDPVNEGELMLIDLPVETEFITPNGRRFLKISNRRTRCLCNELGTKKRYLISGSLRVYPESIVAEAVN